MPATIDCPKVEYRQIDMKICDGCFYKRLDSDYSLMWCKYKIYQTKKNNLAERIKKANIEIAVLKEEQERLYKTGKVRLAQAIEKNILIAKKNKTVGLMINKATSKIIEEAIKINNPVVTAIEEYLRENCNNIEYAKGLLNPQKSLKDCWDEIKIKTKAIKLPDEEVFGLAKRYFGIGTSEAWRSKDENDIE